MEHAEVFNLILSQRLFPGHVLKVGESLLSRARAVRVAFGKPGSNPRAPAQTSSVGAG